MGLIWDESSKMSNILNILRDLSRSGESDQQDLQYLQKGKILALSLNHYVFNYTAYNI